ncbi:hypothetical protein HDV00_012527 [Rhizophlyctis rosea]|nr:hypothetical protein HDV00_012527 [Rhizophlyctis rosea]
MRQTAYLFAILATLCNTTPVVSQLSIDLDAPPSYASSWSSISEVNKLIDSVDAQAKWTLDVGKNVRQTLWKKGLYNRIKKDFVGSLSSLREWRDLEIQSLGGEHTREIRSQDAFWNGMKDAVLTIGFEFGGCGTEKGQRVRRMIVEVDGCTKLRVDAEGIRHTGIKEDDDWYSSTSLNIFDAKARSFRSCQNVCEQGAVAIARQWTDNELTSSPSRLILYSLRPFDPCTTQSLSGPLELFGPTPNLKNIDKQPIWVTSDSDASHTAMFVIGSAPSAPECTAKLETSISQLPIANRTILRSTQEGQQCERLFDGLNFGTLKSYVNNLLNSQAHKSTSMFPSFKDMFAANVDFGTSWNTASSTPADIPFATFHTLKLRQSPPATMTIPSVRVGGNDKDAETLPGPVVHDVYELFRVAMKLRAVDAAKDGAEVDDAILDSIVDLVRVCGQAGSGASLMDVVGAYRNVTSDDPKRKCTDTLFGGVDAVEKIDKALKDREAVASVRDGREKGTQKEVVGRWTVVTGETHRSIWFPQCENGSTLAFEGVFDKDGVLQGPIKSLPTSHFTYNATIHFSNHAVGSNEARIQATTTFNASMIFSAEESVLGLRYNLTRRLSGPLTFHITVANSTQLQSFDVSIICGSSPILSAPVTAGRRDAKSVRSQQTDTGLLLETFNKIMTTANETTKSSDLPVPLPAKYLGLSYALPSTSNPLATAQSSYSLSLSTFTILHNARRLNFTNMPLPAVLRPLFNVTDVCGAEAGVSKVVYRNDVWRVGNCSSVGKGDVGVVVLESGKGEQLFVLPVDTSGFEFDNARKLLRAIEGFRVEHGIPIMVAGSFEVRHVRLLQRAVQENRLWKSIYSPSSPLTTTGIWFPHLPTTTSSLVAPHLALDINPITSHTACILSHANLTTTTTNTTTPYLHTCTNIEPYAKWFRSSSPSTILNTEWIGAIERHIETAADYGDIPILYDVVVGGRTLKVVSYNIGSGVSGTASLERLAALRASPIFGYLSGFDVLLVQGLPGGEEVRREVAGWMDEAVGEGVEFLMSEVDSHGGLEVFWKVGEGEKKGVADLEVVECVSESYGPARTARSVLGCIFAVQGKGVEVKGEQQAGNATHVIIATVNDIQSSHPLTNPEKDLADRNAGVLKRVYKQLAEAVHWKADEWKIPAVILGAWNTDTIKVDGTYDEFTASVKEVDEQILRKNQLGDARFPTGYNPDLKIKIVVPNEHLHGVTEVAPKEEKGKGWLNWLMGKGDDKGKAERHSPPQAEHISNRMQTTTTAQARQFPFWTHTATGTLRSFAVVFSPSNATHDTFVPASGAKVDWFLGSRLCSHEAPMTAVERQRCSQTNVPSSGVGLGMNGALPVGITISQSADTWRGDGCSAVGKTFAQGQGAAWGASQPLHQQAANEELDEGWLEALMDEDEE